jgi:4-amino-4-deoxy-L-arabinose transferase-like glycosyltransferase
MNLESRYGALFFLIAIHALYFIAAIQLQGIYLVDSYGYLHQAKNIAVYNTWYAEDWNAPLLVDYFSIRPPLYGWLIAVFQLITPNIFLLLLVQNVLSILNLWMVYRFAIEHGCDRKHAGIVLILGTLFYPAQMIHANFVMTEIVFQTLLTAISLSMIRFLFTPSWKGVIDLSALLALSLLTKPVSLFLPFIVLVLMSWKLTETRQWKFLIPLLFTVAVFHAICLQQQHATGYYHYTSIKSINQLKYNARYTLVRALGEHEADSTIAGMMQVADARVQYGERLRYMSNEANQIILYHPMDFAVLFGKGTAAFFVDPGRFDLYHFFTVEESHSTGGLLHEFNTKGFSALSDAMAEAPVMILFLLLVNLCWNICMIAAFLYFLFIKRVHLFIRLVVFLVVIYIAAATGPVGVSRYRVPIYPELLLAAMFAVHYLQRGKKTANA